MTKEHHVLHLVLYTIFAVIALELGLMMLTAWWTNRSRRRGW